MGVCLPNFRSVSFFVWPGDVAQINKYIKKYTDIHVKIEITSSGCSPHVDFENGQFFSVSSDYKGTRFIDITLTEIVLKSKRKISNFQLLQKYHVRPRC